MERFAGAALLVGDGRMLELQYPPMRGLYVRDVPFAVDRLENDLLTLAATRGDQAGQELSASSAMLKVQWSGAVGDRA